VTIARRPTENAVLPTYNSQKLMQNLVHIRERAARGDDEVAFTALLQPILEPGYRLACAMLHDPQAAEDAVQEAALKAWRKLDRLREGAEIRPWFLGIVANECRTTRRSGWWARVSALVGDRPVEVTSDSVLTGVEVRRALRSLEHRSRLVLVLRWFLDLPIDEIARVTGLSVHAVESRLARATRDLRTKLQAMEVGNG
jgi:RNA polymerase sigma-70 factor (ECF subfamily)